MFAHAFRALRRSVRDPGYLLYFLRNVDVLHDRFPRVCRWWRIDRKSLRLGGPRAFSRLHVILRTTDRVLNVNASRDLREMGIETKADVIRVGACSLFPAARKFVGRYGASALKVTVVADRLSEAGRRLYERAAEGHALPLAFVASRGEGNGPSFQTQVDVALHDSDDTLALILEDDYLLDPDALVTAYSVLSGCSNVVGLNPHFHPDRIRFQDVRRFCAIGGRVYGRVGSTCCTFFMPVAEMRRHERRLRRYDGWEAGSIGEVWKRSICLAPFGWTMAEHLHRPDLSPACSARLASSVHGAREPGGGGLRQDEPGNRTDELPTAAQEPFSVGQQP